MERVEVLVDNRVRIRARALPAEVAEKLQGDFTYKNPQRDMLRRIGKPFWAEPKTISTWGTEGEWLTFPRGGIGKVRARLEEAGIARRVVDARVNGTGRGDAIPEHRFTPWPFQATAVANILAKESGILRAPTAAGKTCVGFMSSARAKRATLVIVYNSGLFKQWVRRAEKELGLRPEQIGAIRGGERKLRPLTIAMQQTLSSRGVDQELKDYFGMVIVDECHRAAAATMFRAVDPFPARYRIGISADHRRKDRKEFLTEDLFGPIIDDIPRAQLIKDGHVLDVQVRVIPTDSEAEWYGMPTEIDHEGHEVETDREIDTVRLNQYLAEDLARNEMILSCVMDELDRGEQVLVFSHLREHCMVLDQRLVGLGVQTGFLIGGTDYSAEFDKTVRGVERGTTRVCVGTYQAVGQALDLPTLSVGVCATPIGSNKQTFNQVRGRVSRVSAGKGSARLYYPWDRNIFGWKHLQNIAAWNADTVVRENGEWVPVRDYMRRNKK